MPAIEDIEKLNPALLEKSAAQLEREITEREMALAKLREIEAEKKRAANLKLAQGAFDKLMDAMNELHGLGYLPKLLEEIFTIQRGDKAVFNPAVKLKRPRG